MFPMVRQAHHKAKPLETRDLIQSLSKDESAVAGYLPNAFRRVCSQSSPQSRQLPGDVSTCQSERLPVAMSRVRAVTQHVPSFIETFFIETSPVLMTLG
jgi:hypothetical protein